MMTPNDLSVIHSEAFVDQRPWSEAEFAGFLSSPHVFLANLENAFALGRVIAGEVELLTLAVAPDAQGKGQGRKVLSLYHEMALERHAELSFLEVSDKNQRARSLYDSFGYQITAVRPDYYRLNSGKTADALIMSCKLT